MDIYVGNQLVKFKYINSGGFSRIYSGEMNIDETPTQVCLKLFITEDREAQHSNELDTNAKIVDRLGENNIFIQILQSGNCEISGQNYPYHISQFVPGIPIEEWKPKSLKELIDMFTLIFSEIDILHSKGIANIDMAGSYILDDKLTIVDLGMICVDNNNDSYIKGIGKFAITYPPILQGEYQSFWLCTVAEKFSIIALLFHKLANLYHRQPTSPGSFIEINSVDDYRKVGVFELMNYNFFEDASQFIQAVKNKESLITNINEQTLVNIYEFFKKHLAISYNISFLDKPPIDLYREAIDISNNFRKLFEHYE